jgi:hypothetical protein
MCEHIYPENARMLHNGYEYEYIHNNNRSTGKRWTFTRNYVESENAPATITRIPPPPPPSRLYYYNVIVLRMPIIDESLLGILLYIIYYVIMETRTIYAYPVRVSLSLISADDMRIQSDVFTRIFKFY